jgi:hypothetical protein
MPEYPRAVPEFPFDHTARNPFELDSYNLLEPLDRGGAFSPPPDTCFLLLQDGVSHLLLQNGVDALLMECAAVLYCSSIAALVTGADMAGLEVTALFDDAFSETVIWQSLGSGAGQAVGTGWSITESGDTISSFFLWENTRGVGVTQILFHDPTQSTIFDRGGDVGTPGSSIGFTFFLVSVGVFNYTATYSGPTALVGQAIYGDIWATLTIDFTDPGGFTESYSGGPIVGFQFDTDRCVH